MRVLAAACLLAGLLLGRVPAWAQDAAPVSAADHHAIEQVITQQLDAFRHDAGAAAFGLASPNIQSMFGDPGNFMRMVRRGYPPVYRPRSFAFQQLTTVDGRIVQEVMLVGPDGAPALALYTMEQQPDGSWRIDGCALTRPAGLTT